MHEGHDENLAAYTTPLPWTSIDVRCAKLTLLNGKKEGYVLLIKGMHMVKRTRTSSRIMPLLQGIIFQEKTIKRKESENAHKIIYYQYYMTNLV